MGILRRPCAGESFGAVKPERGTMRISSVSLALAAVLAVGCTTTSGTDPVRSYSGFDRGAVVDIAGHGAACTAMLCPGLGAQWQQARPDRAILNVYLFNVWTPITQAALNIDGRIVQLDNLTTITNFSPPGSAMRESRRSFAVELQLIRDILAANRVWLRVGTTDGTVEVAVIDGAQDSRPFNALKRFIAAVDTR